MRYKQYQMSEEKRTRLVEILGETEQTQKFLKRLIDCIDDAILTNRLTPNIFRTNGQRFGDLKKINEAAKDLVMALKPVRVDYEASYDEDTEEGQDFIENVDPSLGAYLMMELRERTGDSDPNQIIKLIETLSSLSVCCNTVGDKLFTPKRGDKSPDEMRMQVFEHSCVFHYLASYNCLPAKSPGGAFLKVMIEAYKEAGFPQALGNAYQRLQKAINRYSENFCKDEAESMKPRRKLHPPIND